MEEQKYYTPALEDLHPGMLVEVNTSGNKDNPKYELWTISDEDVSEISQILWDLKHRENAIRVPYLTAEQIEAEGWTRESTVGNDICLTKSTVDGAANLMCFKHHRVIICRNGAPIYNGTIRCINDLRSISNLIGI